MTKIPQIQFTHPNSPVSGCDMLKLDPNTSYGNLTSKTADISVRLKKVNKDLKHLYEKPYQIDSPPLPAGTVNPENFFTPIEVELIVYNIRVATDQLICLLYILNYNNTNNSFPEQIKIDSIGKYLSPKITDGKQYLSEFDHFKNFLQTLNNISNAYKHSFLNSDTMSLRGKSEPVVFALGLKANNITNSPTPYSITLSDVVIQFDEMYQKILEELKKFITY